MIIERREFHCGCCKGIKLLKKNEKEPDVCPFCGVDKYGKTQWTKMWWTQQSGDKK